jgi:hypothetical protein
MTKVIANEIKPVGLAEQNFARLIRTRGIYVDKTALIYDLIAGEYAFTPLFLSRPRRFGKTLLLDTIQNIFQGRRDLFTGLQIQNRLKGKWDRLPVINISLNTTKTVPELFESSLLMTVKQAAVTFDIDLRSDNSSSAILELITALSRKKKLIKRYRNSKLNPPETGNVVLLIDEYDYPLIGNIGNPDKQEDIRLILRDFYSCIKYCSKLLRFVLITGITKFSQLSVFSSLNNTLDISLDSNFANICGFTQEEIELAFAQHLIPTLDKLKSNQMMAQNATVTDLIKRILDRYDGYSWDAITHVLNPYSVSNLFFKKEFGNFWYDSGSPLLTSKISRYKTDYFKIFNKNLSLTPPFPQMDFNRLNDTIVLMQAGYLTISSIDPSGAFPKYLLKIPNEEITESIQLELLTHLVIPPEISDASEYLNQTFLDFLDAFGSHDEEKCEEQLSAIFANVVQQDPKEHNESFFRTILQLLLSFGNKLSVPESCSDIGRSDLVIQTPLEDFIVIEIKHEKAKPSATITNCLNDSHHQPNISTHENVNSSNVIEIGKKSEYVLKIHNNNINSAFAQIVNKHYAVKHLGTKSKVYASAISIYGTSDFMVRFKPVVWKTKETTQGISLVCSSFETSAIVT